MNSALTHCPHCGHCLETSSTLADLKAWAEEHGHWIGPSETVTEQVAAQMLGRSENTLRGWRGTDGRLAYTRSGGRIRYRLADLAAFLDEKR